MRLASIYVLELINGDHLGSYREQIMPLQLLLYGFCSQLLDKQLIVVRQ